jgi:cobalt transporter subunit CbtA
MIRHFLASALLAGLLTGLAVTGLQQTTTTPLILQAEQYEAAASAPASTAPQPHAPGIAAHEQAHSHGGQNGGWAPTDGMERLFFTALANVITGIGFAFLLVAFFALSKGKPSGQAGALWGMAGFAVFPRAPSLGLAPELPAMSAAGLVERQIWWIFAAAAAAAGLWLLVFPRKPLAAAAGIVAIALPHLVGAPHPAELSAQVPPELASRFAAASIATSALFWVCLGWLAGALYARGNATAEPAARLSAAE